MSMRKVAVGAIEWLPDKGFALKRLYRLWWAARRKRLLERHVLASGWRLPSPALVLSVAPARIAMHTNYRPDGGQRELRNRVFGPDVLPGSVLDGDWDRECPPFEDLAACRSIRDRVLHGTPWRETAYFAESMRDIDAGRPLWECHNADELEARLSYVDSLVESVRQHGLLPQRKVSADHDPTRRYSDEVEVNIGRDGDILFQDGRHRMCIAKVLGIPNIPVKVRARHLLWQQFREQLFDLCQSSEPVDGAHVLPQPAPHPDLGDVPAHPAAERCLQELLPLLVGRRARVLDLGCRLGYFSHSLEAAGHLVIASEGDTRWREAAGRLRLSEQRAFELLSTWDAHSLAGAPFDAMLVMGNAPGWHHTEHDLAALTSALPLISTQAPSVFLMTTGASDAPDLPEPVCHNVANGTLLPPRVLSVLPGNRVFAHLPGRPA